MNQDSKEAKSMQKEAELVSLYKIYKSWTTSKQLYNNQNKIVRDGIKSRKKIETTINILLATISSKCLKYNP